MSRNKFDEKMLFSKALRERMDAEAVADADLTPPIDALWLSMVVRDGGHLVIERNYNPAGDILDMLPVDPTPAQMIWAEQQVKLLNKEVSHGGAWVVGFTHPPSMVERTMLLNTGDAWKRVVKIWLDKEGDPAFTIDNIDPFWANIETYPEHFIEQAEQAWQKYHYLMKQALDPRSHQLIPLAHMKERGTA